MTIRQYFTAAWRYVRGIFLFALAAFAAWSAARHLRGKVQAQRRQRAAVYTDDATREHERAQRAGRAAEKAKNKAESRIKKLREDGHTSMADAVESLNDL